MAIPNITYNTGFIFLGRISLEKKVIKSRTRKNSAISCLASETISTKKASKDINRNTERNAIFELLVWLLKSKYNPMGTNENIKG
jgi:hypothetical protein